MAAFDLPVVCGGHSGFVQRVVDVGWATPSCCALPWMHKVWALKGEEGLDRRAA